MSDSLIKPVLALVAAAGCWGVATAISKQAVAQIPPQWLLSMQLAVSVALLLVLIWAQRLTIDWTPSVRRLGALGLLNPGLSYTLSLLGLARISASLSVLLWAVEPLLILALAWLVLGERLTLGRMMLILAGTGGVILALGGVSGGRVSLSGVTLTLAGVAACAVYTVLTRRHSGNEATLVIVTVQQMSALVMAVLLAVWLVPAGSGLMGVTGGALLQAALSGVLYYAAAFWFYLTGLRQVGAATAGLFINLIPVFGIGAGYLLLGETLGSVQWVGVVVIIASVTAVGLAPSARWVGGASGGETLR
jgi:probable blue pigment (indigoidine) exporter